MPHIHDLIDFIVSIFIVHNDKVLLIHHRKLDKWLPVGGHIELDEDPEEALFREVREECGLEIKILGDRPEITSESTKFLYAPSFLDIHKITGDHKHIGLVYFAVSDSDKFIFNEKECKDIRWFSKEDLDRREFDFEPAVRFYAEEAIKISALKIS